MKKLLLLLSSLLATVHLYAQQSVTIPINHIDDDLEEWIPGTGQTKTVGAIDNGSSDIEFGMEGGNADPQLVGLRFNNISIPKGAVITRAYIQFTVDATNKNADPCNVWIKVQDADNATAFNPLTNFTISSRTMVADSVNWAVGGSSWNTVGSAGPEQQTADISKLLQKIVDRNGWASGNSLVLTMKGTGTREVESYDGSAPDAAKLVIYYIPLTTATFAITAADDDQEEWLSGANLGMLDNGSSDLELGYENGASDPQVVGVRYTNVTIPKRSLIKSAYLQFTCDATNKNSDPSNLWIKVQDADNPAIFNPLVNFNITSRSMLNDSVAWNIPNGSWTVVGQAGADQRSTNIAQLLQSIVDRNGWTSGNSVVFTIKGTGTRESESYDGSAPDAPKLIVEYVPVTSTTFAITAADDDQEEWLSGANLGMLDGGSSDLEFGHENGASDPQMVGMRFNNIAIPRYGLIRDARIRFTVDATNKNSDPVNVWVKAQDADNPVIFNPLSNFNITSRAKIADSVNWVIPSGTWTVVGASGADQTTPDIKNLVQALVNRGGWNSGNSMAFFIHGTGTREAESYDGSAPDAPKLVIDFLSSAGGPTPPPGPTPNPFVNYPLAKSVDWSYLDTGNAPSTWKDLNFNDTVWQKGKASLGYNANAITKTISYGADSNNKHITTYYRKRVNIADVATLPNNLELQLRADDGAVVYVNGSEVLRVNLPTGNITNTTLATTDVKQPQQDVYFTYEVPKTSFVTGMNIVAVEVHQVAANSRDHAFDLAIKNPVGNTNPTDMGCVVSTDTHIGCFTSLIPRPQNDTFQIPSTTHVYQFLSQTGDAHTLGGGNVKSNFDFTGYVPFNGSSKKGYVALNHERGNKTGGVTVFDVRFNDTTGLWIKEASQETDFTMVAGTQANCSGGVTPWGTSITCEEDYPGTGDANNDGYIDIGWNVEIDPVTHKPKDYGNGPEKLWAMGRMSHENVVVSKDKRTAYYGEDDGLGALYKFVADTPGNLSKGQLFVLKLNAPLVSNEPTNPTGYWIQVPNTTKAERNNVKMFGSAMGTTFSGIEDVEIGTVDSQIYFTAKGLNRIYRFIDNGSMVSGFITYAGGKEYRVSSGGSVITEDWGSGNDNLTFDDRGNLWVLQDGSRNHVWVIRPGHTQANPKIEVFMHTPIGSEPTGMTFTPDYKYMFISIQEPSTALAAPQTDIAGVTKTVNKSTMMVIGRKEFLGVPQPLDTTDTSTVVRNVVVAEGNIRIYPNPFAETAHVELEVVADRSDVMIEVMDITGKTVQAISAGKLDKGTYKYTISAPVAGFYLCNITINNVRTTYKLIKQ